MNGPELKPCPFCGGMPHIHEDASHSTAFFADCYNDNCTVQPSAYGLSKAEAIAAWNTRAPVDYAALPEVQALIAGAFEAAAREVDTAGDAAVTGALGEQLCCSGHMCGCQGADVGTYLLHIIRALTPADAIAARDAMIAEAEARARAGVTTLHTVIADIRAATVGSKPMLSELAAALVEWRDEAVKAEREAIVTYINGRIDYVNDCAKWGGSKQYLQSLKGGVVELTHTAAAIRKRGEG